MPEIPVTYFREWQDGFGARGWKLDASTRDPAVIASTAETGCRVPTSVLVHDVLDHYLCGFSFSSHTEEAGALIQLSVRTGSDPTPDFAQMVDEDILPGLVSTQALLHFLPPTLQARVGRKIGPAREIITSLTEQLGRDALRSELIARFFQVGEASCSDAVIRFCRSGLDYQRRTAMGLCLQRILEEADTWVVERALPQARGQFILGNEECSLEVTEPAHVRFAHPVGS